MVLPLPITNWETSPLNFKSCGISPITANEKMRVSAPIFVCPRITTCELQTTFWASSTRAPIQQNGPISQPGPIRAPGSMTADGVNLCGGVNAHLAVSGKSIMAVNSASAAISPLTKPRPLNFQIFDPPRIVSTCNSRTSPGTTLRRNLHLSIAIK